MSIFSHTGLYKFSERLNRKLEIVFAFEQVTHHDSYLTLLLKDSIPSMANLGLAVNNALWKTRTCYRNILATMLPTTQWQC